MNRHVDIRTEPVWIDADALRLEQVLANIMANAVKYTPPGGWIRIALRVDDGDAVLTVDDAGFGISPRLLPLIFDLYVQADRTIDRAQGGLGLGSQRSSEHGFDYHLVKPVDPDHLASAQPGRRSVVGGAVGRSVGPRRGDINAVVGEEGEQRPPVWWTRPH